MVLKVARAICCPDGCHNAGSVRICQAHTFYVEALAAMEALMTPTAEMLAAAMPLVGRHCDPGRERLAKQAALLLAPTEEVARDPRGAEIALDLIRDWEVMLTRAMGR